MVAAGAAGSAGGGNPTYVDDVFSTFLYDGTGSTQSINNGIDLSGEGGLTWVKCRSDAADHRLIDTERGANNILTPNDTSANFNNSTIFSSFNSDGFSVATDAATNWSGRDYTSWTFRKAPGFFDVVTYTGNGSVRTISHNLGSVPGMIICKRLDTSSQWPVWHRSVSLNTTAKLQLEETSSAANSANMFTSTAPTSTEFTIGTHSNINDNGGTYVAYIFAHDDQSFGTDSDEAIIKCGSYTGVGTSGLSVDLGFEPQFVLVKSSTLSNSRWVIFDMMRGMTDTSQVQIWPNLSDAEYENTSSHGLYATPTGFACDEANNYFNNGLGTHTYVYMAIRRPNKPPEAGTDVFSIATASQYAAPVNIPCDFAPDFFLAKTRTTAATFYAEPRLTDQWMETSSTAIESTADYYKWDGPGGKINLPDVDFNNDPIFWQFRRAPGIFDAVAYTGTGSLSGVNHNLGVTPELKIIKNRDETWGDWIVGGSAVNGENGYVYINSTAGLVSFTNYWDGGDDSATQFSVRNTNGSSDYNGDNYIAYLFATLDGISKVGSYTGTGSAINVDCGFTAGARFVLIKRTDSTGDWYVWDTTRGIVSGNDPYLLLNSTAAEVTNTDYIDPLNAGFTVTSSAPAALNTSGGTYLFLAIA